MNSDEDDRTVIRPRGARIGPGAPTPADSSADAPTMRLPTPLPTSTSMQTPATAAAAPTAPTHHAITLPAGTRLGEFEVTSTIGEGGFGIVYLAWDHSLDRKVALKEYMPSSIAFRAGQSEIRARSERHQETFDAGMKSFINEAKLLAQFDHPSLLKVYRFWEANGTAYMVMPFLEGATLRDTVRAMTGPPDEAWIVGLLQPVCDALAMLHAVQIYHRDIAPDNILLLAETGRPLLLDFGAARRVIGDMTQALTAILKPGYAPVEQYADMPGLKQGPWTDVYALAAVVHWMILGKTPSPSVGRLFDDAYVPLTQSAAGRYSDGFLQAIDRGLAVMPDKRTQTVEAFRNDLLGATVAGGPVSASTLAMATTAMPSTTSAATSIGTRQDERHPAPPATASVAVDAGRAPPRGKLPLVLAAVAVIGIAVAALMFWPRPSPPALSSTEMPRATSPVMAPAATPVMAPVVAPVTAPDSNLQPPVVVAEPPSPAASSATVVASPPPVGRRVALPKADIKTEPRERRSEPLAQRRSEPTRGTESRNADVTAAASNRDECARLFQRLSIGDTDQSLIDRIRTLKCR